MSQRCFFFFYLFKGPLSFTLAFFTNLRFSNKKGSSPRPKLHVVVSFKLTLNTMTTTKKKNAKVTHQVKEKLPSFPPHLIWGCLWVEPNWESRWGGWMGSTDGLICMCVYYGEGS